MIKDTPYHSKCINDISTGCKYCVKGQKLVLFITGICPRACYFCPLSDKKYHKDVIYANERPIDPALPINEQINELMAEAKMNSAKGAGITGGDPLAKLDRTVEYIIALKKEFSDHFHIHLYTSFDLVDEKSLKKLFDAGLDEIRFHPDIENEKDWKKIKLAKKHSWQIGIEIPVIPGKKKETLKLLDYFIDYVDFINLNELEIADNSTSKLAELGYTVKDELSYGIKGSEDLADDLLKYLEKTKKNVHYCTARLKDAVQLANRIKLRAKNVAKYYEEITDDGTIKRAIIYLDDIKPGFDYSKELESIRTDKSKKQLVLAKLSNEQRRLDKLNIKTEIDGYKFRLITHMKFFKKERTVNDIKDLGLLPAIIEEYPTYDAIELDVNFL